MRGGPQVAFDTKSGIDRVRRSDAARKEAFRIVSDKGFCG